MPDPLLSPESLAAIAARCEAATPEPWTARDDVDGQASIIVFGKVEWWPCPDCARQNATPTVGDEEDLPHA